MRRGTFGDRQKLFNASSGDAFEVRKVDFGPATRGLLYKAAELKSHEADLPDLSALAPDIEMPDRMPLVPDMEPAADV